jgi:hypothetical protein
MTVSPTNWIDDTGVTATIGGNKSMHELGLTGLEELRTDPALPPSTNAINQANVELTADIAEEVEYRAPTCRHWTQ